MAYAQDTIISANAPATLAAVLEGLLIDAGWTLVEAMTPTGTNTPTTKVYLSDGDDNLAGYDWYICLKYKGVGTEAQMEIIPGGAYNSGTNILSQIPAQYQGGNSTFWSDSGTGDFFGGLDVNVQTNTNLQVNSNRSSAQQIDKPWWSTIVPSSAFGYWASVTLDHFALWTTIADGAPTPGPASFFASTLDVDAEWLALNSSGFGPGVAVNPIVMASRNYGISASLIGVGLTSSPAIRVVNRKGGNYGSLLPTLAGNWIDGYAWRWPWYWSSATAFGTTVPAWDNPASGDGLHIGDGIDYYAVRGGTIGDTVEIDSATYVLSGLIGQQSTSDTNGAGIYLAVLVE